jgi:hypothetical protein
MTVVITAVRADGYIETPRQEAISPVEWDHPTALASNVLAEASEG